MTKPEWRGLWGKWKGTRVTMTLNNNVYEGEIVRENSNGSQVLVQWDCGYDIRGNKMPASSPIWYGRTGIELKK